MPQTDWRALAQGLTQSLGLRNPPLAITFTDRLPAGVERFEEPVPAPYPDGRTGRVPAGCVFWMKGMERTFATAPEDHFNCSVGSVTHGLKTLGEVMGNEDVKALLESGWVSPQEAMGLPFVPKRHAHVLYGPLAEAGMEPDVVLLLLNPFQAMVLHDAFPETVFAGKPQCHIVPIAREQKKIAISTGCMLSRVRTGMSPGELTCTLPASRLAEIVKALQARQKANAAVANYASQDGQRFKRA